MQKKIVTKTDSNLITLQYGELDNQSLGENELLIKQLLFILKSEGRYISAEDQKRLKDYQILDNQVNRLLNKFKVSNLRGFEILVEKQKELLGLKDVQNAELKAEHALKLGSLVEEHEQQMLASSFEFDLAQSEHETICLSYQQQIAKLEATNAKLEAERDTYIRKYEGQKNRKAIRLIDKVAKR